MTTLDALVGLAILVGLVGIVVPVLPGSILVVGAVLVWAVYTGTALGWGVFAVATALVAVGAVVKFTIPGRGLRTNGVPRSTIVLGGVLGIIGFFVVPVVGLFLGFVLGVYLSELGRVGRARAWPTTWAAVRAVGLTILIELAAALLATAAWIAGVAAA